MTEISNIADAKLFLEKNRGHFGGRLVLVGLDIAFPREAWVRSGEISALSDLVGSQLIAFIRLGRRGEGVVRADLDRLRKHSRVSSITLLWGEFQYRVTGDTVPLKNGDLLLDFRFPSSRKRLYKLMTREDHSVDPFWVSP